MLANRTEIFHFCKKLTILLLRER